MTTTLDDADKNILKTIKENPGIKLKGIRVQLETEGVQEDERRTDRRLQRLRRGRLIKSENGWHLETDE